MGSGWPNSALGDKLVRLDCGRQGELGIIDGMGSGDARCGKGYGGHIKGARRLVNGPSFQSLCISSKLRVNELWAMSRAD